jgi:hypothetical protein
MRALHSNICTRHVSWHLLYCGVWASPSNGWCLRRHLLATGLYATIYQFSVNIFILNLQTWWSEALNLFITKINYSQSSSVENLHKNKPLTCVVVTNSMELTSSWDAASRSATQKNPYTLWNPNAHYRVDKSPPPSLSWGRWIQSIPRNLNYRRFILVSSSRLRLLLPSGFLSDFRIKILYAFLFLPHIIVISNIYNYHNKENNKYI